MSRDNIYTVGGTVQAGGGLYLARKADEELLQECRSGNYAYILSTRQVGKSSLMVRTVESLSDSGIRSVVVDLSQIGVNVTQDEWYRGFLYVIVDQLALDVDVADWWESNSKISHTDRFTNFFRHELLPKIAESLVVFVDEIDTTRNLKFTDDFYAAIRFMFNARPQIPEFKRLSFVLIGVATPNDLIQDPVRTPFNIATPVELSDFTLEEAQPLVGGFNLSRSDAELVLKRILKWTGGHPFLTLRICRLIANLPNDTWTEADVDRLVADTFFGEKSDTDPNLQFVSDMLTRRSPNSDAVLTAYRKVRRRWRRVRDDEPSMIKTHLKLSGVVRREKATLQVRNAVYRRVFDEGWVKDHLTVNWPKRLAQTATGLVLTLLILAVPLAIYAWNRKTDAEDALIRIRESAARESEAKASAEAALSRETLAKQETERKRVESENLRALAEAAAKKEKESSLLAEQLRKIAEKQKLGAESAAREARFQKGMAETEKEKAESAALEAQLQRKTAESRLLEMERQRRLAEKARAQIEQQKRTINPEQKQE